MTTKVKRCLSTIPRGLHISLRALVSKASMSRPVVRHSEVKFRCYKIDLPVILLRSNEQARALRVLGPLFFHSPDLQLPASA